MDSHTDRHRLIEIFNKHCAGTHVAKSKRNLLLLTKLC